MHRHDLVERESANDAQERTAITGRLLRGRVCASYRCFGWLLAATSLAGLVACGVASADGELGDRTLAARGGSGGALLAPSVAADSPDDSDEPKDYWGDVSFDQRNFEEVRQRVRKAYIDPVHDDVLSYAHAASFAVGSHEKSGKILLPEKFWRARKNDKAEEGGLSGKMRKLHPSDAFVLLDEVEIKDSNEALSDKELRKRRAAQRARSKALMQAWRDTKFSAKDFDRVMAYIKREFKPVDRWTYKKAWVAAAQGYLYALDPHSSLVARAAWEDSTRKTTDASFDGIGAILAKRPSSRYTIVESPIDGQPAVKAGLRAGDQIIKVDGKNTRDESLSKVVSRIRGPRGSTVVLTVRREGLPKPKDIAIQRARIDSKNVQARLIKGASDVGYIKITGFVRTTDRDLDRAYNELVDATESGKLRGLVLDMRNNSGGLLNQGIKVADRFLRGGTIVTVKNRSAREDESYMAHAEDTWDVPMVVLVNDGTASAAEIVASAVQDNRRGLVIGDRTFGKASVQTLYSPILQDDYYIKLTVARYYSPLGRTLQVVGVQPDITVSPDFKGDMPLGFREENLWGHLGALDKPYKSPNQKAAKRAEACAAATGKRAQRHAADPNPAIRFDNQLMLGLDVLECAIGDRLAVRGSGTKDR